MAVGGIALAGLASVLLSELPKRIERADGLPQTLIDDFPRQ